VRIPAGSARRLDRCRIGSGLVVDLGVERWSRQASLWLRASAIRHACEIEERGKGKSTIKREKLEVHLVLSANHIGVAGAWR
jgi:hypothetical protein